MILIWISIALYTFGNGWLATELHRYWKQNNVNMSEADKDTFFSICIMLVLMGSAMFAVTFVAMNNQGAQ